MKIALVRQRYFAFGGAERYLDELARQLLARGHEVHLFANEWNEAPGAPRLIFHRVPVLRATSGGRALSFALNCRRLLRQESCDRIFSVDRTLWQDVYRASGGCHREYLIQRLRHAPHWKRATIWFNPLHRIMLWLERRVYSRRNTGIVIANSVLRKEEIVRHYGFPADRIHVVFNGVDGERFRFTPRETRRDQFVLLFVGSGFRGKGLAYCVRALAKLPANVVLRVVGKGKPGSYERLARKLGVASRLSFTGTVTDMPAVYAASDLLVLPAVYEAFANVCLEAMACGLPVVTSRINGASEVIEPGINGAIIEEPSDVDALAEGIRRFLDRKVLAEAAIAARRAAERLPFSLNTEKTLAVIELARVSWDAQNISPCTPS
jgi:UDP-glucose:(heptosyl)LPS alpha-1,3-glucosyltransferase